MTTRKIGIIGWGGVVILLTLVTVVPILTGWPQDVYIRIKDCSEALATIIGAATLAWSWFYRSPSETQKGEKPGADD